MCGSDGGAQAGLGVDDERGRGHDSLSGGKTREDLEIVVEAQSRLRERKPRNA